MARPDEVEPRSPMPWETAKPVTVEVTIKTQCYPIGEQLNHIGTPINEVCAALYKHGRLKAYQIQQALEGLASFWTKVHHGDAEPEDYDGPR